jgi:hypothetical protein
MKKLMCIVGLVCAFAVAGVATSGAAPASPAVGINYRVCGGPAPIHSSYSSGSPTIGYLQNGEVFEATQNSLENFDYGYAYGSVHAYGYMNRHFEC